ncbi:MULTISPECIES: carboxypeptidase-like regulatory domain-containing protein [unclassified Polaribacter]|uniref:carboxypeptidase-like regulatory domain-containing protein n=1 Tax=unclassified Polaribacter TaxID=196858 RepID=UPI0011BECD8D|nr:MULTISPECIES: carboxypeptidase-like regulatory domain-containing protein [unclassified Polaribacter]TXD50801.1 carboxypeptidase-like regulatory domain-containing protein [Polaribacter sp. IC063]TXD57543.1 carboxypeptidase-like regulatory domain-containing protein [Polaribacter sp. IC066]
MKEKIVVFLLLIPFLLCSQTENNTDNKTISGFVFSKNERLSNVNVFVEGTLRYTVTDAQGFYSIKAQTGETLKFSYIGLKEVLVLIEDVTSTLNINLKIENSISGLNPDKVLKLGESNIGDDAAPYMIRSINGKSLNQEAPSLTSAIQDKIAGLLIKINEFGEEIIYLKGRELEGPALWIIDRVTYDIPIPIYISEVKNVLIINSKENGFIIKVNTNIDYSKIKNINYTDYYFTKTDFYQNDAFVFRKIKTKQPEFLDAYGNRLNAKEALAIYLNQYETFKNTTNYHFDIFNYFKGEKYNNTTLIKVLSDFEKFSEDNPEDLKGIAYKYQEINEHEKALSVYKKTVKLRPDYRQSYRDLANTYLTLKEYRDFWLAYQYYLKKDFKIEDSDIGEIIASEILLGYTLDTEETSTHQKIKIDNPQKNIESDVRIVFEWNTSEAEFILEFVNPNSLPYIVENSSDSHNELIIDQKNKGYTSKEIFIEDLKKGNWLVNLTYLGNKQYKPTIFKTTTYYNWGRPNQSEKIEVFDFTLKNVKMEVLKLNSRSL